VPAIRLPKVTTDVTTEPRIARRRPLRDHLGRHLSFALVLAWALISVGAASHYGTYTPRAIALVGGGVVVLTVAVFTLARVEVRPASRSSLVGACLVALVCTEFYAAGEHSHGPAQVWAHLLLLAAGCGLILLVLLSRPTGALAAVVVGLVAAAGVAGIIASPRPPIDVWYILQGSARAVLHGRNIYGAAWPGSRDHLMPYLPGAAVFLTPFRLLFGDVRYGLLSALILTSVPVALLLRRSPARTAPAGAGLVLACLMVLYPRVLYGIEQSWPEPLLLVFLAGTVWAVQSGRATLAVVLLAAALVTKQHVLILLPLAALWPGFGWRRTLAALAAAAVVVISWFAADPHAFIQGAITFNLTLSPRHDSLSVFSTAIRAGFTPSFILVPAIMLLALGVAAWKIPRSTPGFVLGSAWLLAVFNVVNKQSFFNEWSLVVGLMMLGVATLGAERNSAAPLVP
jgi:hypothetical protein